jgi:endogenous inhibitor of DNA gyrase (YacG/DUF329 family)
MEKVCPICGRSYRATRAIQKYCSRRCTAVVAGARAKEQAAALRHPNTRSGLNLWRKYAGITAESVCAWCGWPRNIVAHHRDSNERNNRPGNVIPVCRSCHQRFHRAGHWLNAGKAVGTGHHKPPRPGQPGTPEFPDAALWERRLPTVYAVPSQVREIEARRHRSRTP